MKKSKKSAALSRRFTSVLACQSLTLAVTRAQLKDGEDQQEPEDSSFMNTILLALLDPSSEYLYIYLGFALLMLLAFLATTKLASAKKGDSAGVDDFFSAKSSSKISPGSNANDQPRSRQEAAAAQASSAQ